MIKKMCINIEFDTERHTPQDIKDSIVALIDTCADNSLAIDRVFIDEEENYKVGVGFMGTMKRRFV